MSVDLAKLQADEEWLRTGGRAPHTGSAQNVLDALNFYRCLALHREQELARVPEVLRNITECAEAYYRQINPTWSGEYFDDSEFGMAHALIAKLEGKS